MECSVLFWTNTGSSPLKNNSCMTPYLPSQENIQVRQDILGAKDELISNVIQWIPTHGRTSVGQQAKINIQQLYIDTGCCLEDL